MVIDSDVHMVEDVEGVCLFEIRLRMEEKQSEQAAPSAVKRSSKKKKVLYLQNMTKDKLAISDARKHLKHTKTLTLTTHASLAKPVSVT